MHLSLFILLGVLLVFSVIWFKSRRTSPIRAWFLIILLAAAVLVSSLAPSLDSPAAEYLSAVAVLVAGLGGSIPAAYCVGLVRDPVQPATSQYGQKVTGKLGYFGFKAELTQPQPLPEADGGGKIIGIFERLAVALAIITAQVSLLAVVVGIKGLARYTDIKSGHLTAEKFIIGTFSSLLWASACALVAVNLR